jgi:hypothetical protein
MKHLKTFKSFLNESKKSSVKDLQKELKQLNAKYLTLDKKMDSESKLGKDTEDISDELERIQSRMSEISAELEAMELNSESFLDESLEDAEDKIDKLPKGKIFDDAKRIESIFKMSSHGWSETVEAFEANSKKGKPTTVNVKDIEITQPNIQSGKVKKLMQNLDKAPMINVVQFPDGKQVIFDGHHRLVSHWALGDKKIKVNLVKI